MKRFETKQITDEKTKSISLRIRTTV